MISPAVFIPAAERTGMIELLGMAVIESVFRFMSEHDLKKAGISFIEINLSVAQCVQPQLVQGIQELQDRYGIDPSCVNFEITETMIESIDRVMSDNLNRLLEMGYTLSLDDYGMGFSNVGRVRKLPLRLIKIDKSLVDDMFTEEGSVIIRNTVEMMRGINKQVVMEGVEDREVLDALIAMNCDYIQGFYFSRPLPENTFLEYVMAHNNVQAAGGT
jgi:EAL domain-containing protein (putative c-di-GMP-specific phosphodiesterase class I)